jgi:hypothetical protein
MYIIHIYVCVCSCAKGWPLYAYTHGKQGQTHEWNFPPRPPQRPLLAKTCQADEVSKVMGVPPKYNPNIPNHPSQKRPWKDWKILKPMMTTGDPPFEKPLLLNHILFIFYSILFYGFVGFSTRHDPVCHWESFAPTLVMACPLESWRASSCGMLWPLGPTRWLTAGPMAELNQRKN